MGFSFAPGHFFASSQSLNTPHHSTEVFFPFVLFEVTTIVGRIKTFPTLISRWRILHSSKASPWAVMDTCMSATCYGTRLWIGSPSIQFQSSLTSCLPLVNASDGKHTSATTIL